MEFKTVVEYNPTLVAAKNEYFIIGRCLSGSRHYSENMCFSKIMDVIDKYRAVVDYFGGGTVEVYRATGEKISSEVIMNFDF